MSGPATTQDSGTLRVTQRVTQRVPGTQDSVRPSRIAGAFAQAKAEGRTALMPFITAGYPDMATCEAIVPALVRGGANLIEIGVPFSDPMADGTTIQKTSQVALDNGTRLIDCIELVRRLRTAHGIEIPLVLMGYFNPFYRFGLERLVEEGAAAGVDGFIVPDLPAEEAEELATLCRDHGRDLIFLVAPTSTDRRLREVGAVASGFVYCVSLTGVTGAREQLADELPAYIGRVRAATSLPLAIGFGISTAAHVREVGLVADGAIVASALINHLDRYPKEKQPAQAEAFVRGLGS
jgi:tryptophan synthase alpha chain